MGNFPDLNNNKDSSKHERVQQHFCGAVLGGSACHCADCSAGGARNQWSPLESNAGIYSNPTAAQCLSSSQSACVS